MQQRSDGFTVRVRAGRHQLLDGRRSVAPANAFLRALDVRGLSPSTIRAYAFDLLVLYRWLKQSGKPLEQLTDRDLLDYVEAQRQAQAKPTSINRRLVTCRQLYSFVTGHPLPRARGSSAPAPHYKRGRDRDLGLHTLKHKQRALSVKVPRMLVEPLTREQVCQFLRSLRRYRDLSIVHLMLLCGLRSREVLTLQIADVDFERWQIRIKGKGGKERILPLPQLLRQSLSSYLRYERPRCDAPLFVVLQGPRRTKAMTLAGLRSLFRRRRLTAVIANANPHRFRHTFGADMARAGVRLPTLQRLMGHAQASMTLQYINLSMVDIAEEYRRAVQQIQSRYDR
ncbi:MAG: tyrosine-type recombinase/integrase [bacterium]|nr:tyrosine-type recombinase/integrase [bacterium]